MINYRKSMKRYIIALSLVLISLVVLVGCNGNEEKKASNVITEQHTITLIKGNEIYGENVNGKGEGIYYTKQDFIKLGLDNIKVGQVVAIGWSESNYYNEEWDQVALLELVQ